MKNSLIANLKNFFSDRTMTTLTVVLFLNGISYIVDVALALESSDLQVATRYTAFGETHFYRSKWYYLLSFVVFGVMLAAVHTALAVKLYNKELRQLAIFLLVFTMLLFVIGWIVAESVLEIAFL